MDTAERLLRRAGVALAAYNSEHPLVKLILTYFSSSESKESAAFADNQIGTNPATMLKRDDRGLYDPAPATSSPAQEPYNLSEGEQKALKRALLKSAPLVQEPSGTPERVATLRELIGEISMPLWRAAAGARLDDLERRLREAEEEIKVIVHEKTFYFEVGMAQRLRAEATERGREIVCYSLCGLHQGMWWNAEAHFEQTKIKTICPVCEPPLSAAIQQEQKT